MLWSEGTNTVGEVLAVEVTAGAVRSLRLRRLGPARALRVYAERLLPPGLVVPSATAPNVQDEGAFAPLLAQAIGPRPPRHVRLVLPDPTVRLHVLAMDDEGAACPDVPKFLLWRLQAVLPFDPRDARLAYQTAPDGQPGRGLALALVAHAPALAQYERLFAGLGIGVSHVASVGCHLFNLAALTAAPSAAGPEACLALDAETATLILAPGGVPHYARTWGLPAGPADGGDGCLKDLPEAVRQTFAHAEDTANLPPPPHLVVAGAPADAPGVATSLQQALDIPCRALPPPTLGRHALPPEATPVLAAALARP